jgi:hypothetical protein
MLNNIDYESKEGAKVFEKDVLLELCQEWLLFGKKEKHSKLGYAT